MTATTPNSSVARPRLSAPAWGAALIALAAAAPVIAVLASLVQGGTAPFSAPGGADYLTGTLLLCLLVGGGASLIGAGAAILIAMTDFPGRRVLSFALVLPFAIPAYITAYTYADLLSPFGPLGGLGLPEIRSLPGAAFILTLGVYPYVYLAMRASLAARSGVYMEAARNLGLTPTAAVWRVFLPAGRAALAGGLALALMETAADYGVADYFGLRTLSTGIFRTWYGLGDLTAASQLAAALFLLALLLAAFEETSRRGQGAEQTRAHRTAGRLQLAPFHASLALFFCAIPIIFGFVAPVSVLVINLPDAASIGAARGLTRALFNTGLMGAIGAGLTLALAGVLAYAARHAGSNKLIALAIRTATLGYALPGAVIAIGILTTVTATPGISTVGAGAALLVYAYAARFLTAAYNATAGGLAQISPVMDAAARTLGAGPGRILARLHLPLNRSALAAGALIVFIDIAKELPATLLLQPFDFETMATRIYRLASDERLADAAPAALLLIAMSTLAAILLERLGGGKPGARKNKT